MSVTSRSVAHTVLLRISPIDVIRLPHVYSGDVARQGSFHLNGLSRGVPVRLGNVVGGTGVVPLLPGHGSALEEVLDALIGLLGVLIVDLRLVIPGAGGIRGKADDDLVLLHEVADAQMHSFDRIRHHGVRRRLLDPRQGGVVHVPRLKGLGPYLAYPHGNPLLPLDALDGIAGLGVPSALNNGGQRGCE
jgi:hypothetical protein